MDKRGNRNSGLSLVEMLFYIALMIILLDVLVRMSSGMLGAYRDIKVSKNIESAAVSAMERMTRDIRNASSSTATSTSAEVTLTESAAPTSVRFYVGSSTLKVDENGTYAGPLTPAGVTVTSLVFRKITTAKSQGLKIEMTLSETLGSISHVRNFYDTIELRGSL